MCNIFWRFRERVGAIHHMITSKFMRAQSGCRPCSHVLCGQIALHACDALASVHHQMRILCLNKITIKTVDHHHSANANVESRTSLLFSGVPQIMEKNGTMKKNTLSNRNIMYHIIFDMREAKQPGQLRKERTACN